MRLEDIDLLDRDVFVQGVPHAWFTYLREHQPIFRHPEPHGPGFWVVSKHADVLAISRDSVTYSSDQDRGGVAPSSRLRMRAQDTIEHSPVSDGDTQRRFAAPESAGPLLASAARSGARSELSKRASPFTSPH